MKKIIGETPVPVDDPHRLRVVEVCEQVISRWVATACDLAAAGFGDDKPDARQAIKQIKHLHLAEPWLPAIEIADQLTGRTCIVDGCHAAVTHEVDGDRLCGSHYNEHWAEK